MEVNGNLELKLLNNKKKHHPFRYIVLAAVFVVFMISAFAIISANNKQISVVQSEIDEINAQLSIQEIKNSELKNYANYTDEEYLRYVVKKAHKDLDYVKKGERVFTIVAGN